VRLDTSILLVNFHSDRFSMAASGPGLWPLATACQSNGRCATGRYFQVIGNIHDIESYFGIDNALSLNTQIFLSHWGHLAIIFLWVSGNLFHIGWNGNYELWVKNPIATMPIAHGIWDPHFGLSIGDRAATTCGAAHAPCSHSTCQWAAATCAYSSGGSDYAVVLSYSGIYNWLYASGFSSVFHLYNFVVACELLAVISLLLGKVHLIYLEDMLQWSWQSHGVVGFTSNLEPLAAKDTDTKVGPIFIWPFRLFLACFDLSGLRLNFHIGVMIGFSSIAWCGHLVHVAIPVSRGMHLGGLTTQWSMSLYPLYTGNWVSYSLDVVGAGSQEYQYGCCDLQGRCDLPILTFLGGLKSDTASLYLTDIAHHHLAVGVLFVWAGHVYSSFYKGFGHRIRDVLFVNGNSGSMISSLGKSLHLQLSLALAGLSVITSVVAQHIYSLAPYPYLSYDSVTFVALYVHHSWIASFLMMGSFAHAGIFLIRDYTVNVATTGPDKYKQGRSYAFDLQDVIYRILAHKAAIISHLSWICLWLGFHTLGLYIHNDTVVAFGEPEKQILIEPVFAQIIQGSYCQSFGSFLLPLGPGDLLAHHAIALGLHVTVLILLKGSLDGRGSKLMPDKIHFGYGFACDGPGRGGTCDISAWDSFYLATFWMLNTNAWVIFYFHWKHLTLNTAFQFDESSTYLNGWFRDYLWFNSASLIRGYDALGANDLSVWAWTFLGAHLCWATGFMFLISWRGYWQELIDIILVMHLKTPILYDLWNGGIYTPLALSIVQARFIGLAHFSAGFIFTYAAFVLGATA
jgi:photosystem I P700 chlorophyll a apoprotein A2